MASKFTPADPVTAHTRPVAVPHSRASRLPKPTDVPARTGAAPSAAAKVQLGPADGARKSSFR